MSKGIPMVGLISTIVGRHSTEASRKSTYAVDQLQRLEQAAGFSMAAFESDDDLRDEVTDSPLLETTERTEQGVTQRVASLIDECTAAVTSYLRPAV
jgi:hypothetical protein